MTSHWMSAQKWNELKVRRAMTKEPLNRMKELLHNKLYFKKLKRLNKCYIWDVLLYVCETCTLRKREDGAIWNVGGNGGNWRRLDGQSEKWSISS